MALFSDIDWVILLGVGAFLFVGKENGAILRQFGRYYGRLTRLKQELMTDFAKAADLPIADPRGPLTLRSALIQLGDPTPSRSVSIPAAVTTVPLPAYAGALLTDGHGTAVGSGTWSVAVPAIRREEWQG
ncbi:MAG: hypothetical protein L3K17_03005 [Thermoplasmata archaeon]|nr:hypothetical protein [Thermoplasmata archaeon]